MIGFFRKILSLFWRQDNVEIIDMTHSLSENTPVFPGDPEFVREQLESLEMGSSYNLYRLCFCNHAGTHIDFPLHVIRGGKSSSDFSSEHFCGNGVLIEYDNENPGIDGAFIRKQGIYPGDIVFFKSSRIKNSEKRELDNQAYLETSGANALVDKKVRIVGIDSLSIDAPGNDALSSHHIFLEKDILIVENLDTENVTPGRYRFFIAPLKIPDMDGLPARVYGQKMS